MQPDFKTDCNGKHQPTKKFPLFAEVNISIEEARANKNRISTPRNPLMAEIFFIADKMEKTGRGMKLIHDGMEALGVRLPEWENRNGRTKLTVYRTAFVRKLNERIAAFISARKVGEVFTKKDYMASVPDMTEATAKKDLAMMVEQRLCRKEGADPSSHYVVLDKK